MAFFVDPDALPARIVNIDDIKIGDRIRKDFGDIEELARDIEQNGLLQPPVVTPDLVLIAGERRLRALKRLGWDKVEVRVMTVRDAEHAFMMEIAENDNRKDFTYSERMEIARRMERILKAKAEERMKAGKKPEDVQDLHDPVQDLAQGSVNIAQVSGRAKTRDIVARTVGFGSGEQYRKAKFIAEHGDPELIARLDAGEISVNRAYDELKERLAAEEAARKAAEEALAKAEAEAYALRERIHKIEAEEKKAREAAARREKELQEQIENLKVQLERLWQEASQGDTVEVVKEVVPPELEAKMREIENALQAKERELERMQKETEAALLRAAEEKETEVRHLREKIEALEREKARMQEELTHLSRQASAAQLERMAESDAMTFEMRVRQALRSFVVRLSERAHYEEAETIARAIDRGLSALEDAVHELRKERRKYEGGNIIDVRILAAD